MSDNTPANDKIEELAQEIPSETESLAAEVVSNDDLGEDGNDRAEDTAENATPDAR